jgi:hypothetical protein
VGVLNGSSIAALRIAEALGLPSNTMAFTLEVRAGKDAVLRVEMFVEESSVPALVTELKKYELVEKAEEPR